MKYVFLVICFIISFNITAQDVEFLMNTVAKMPDDTNKLNALNILADKAPDPVWINYNKQAYELSKKLFISPDKLVKRRANLGVADAFNNFAFEHESKGELEKAIEYWKKALKITVDNKDKLRTAVLYNNLGYTHYKKADYKTAIEYYNKSISYKEGLKDSMGVANTLVNIGSIYSIQGDYKQAVNFYGKALRIYEKKGDDEKIGITYVNIGNANLRMTDYKNAQTYFNSAKEIYRKNNHPFGIANCDLNLGVIQLDFYKDLSKADEFFMSSLKGFQMANDSDKICITQIYQSKVLTQNQKVEEAYQLSKKSYDYFVRKNSYADLTLAASNHQLICARLKKGEEERNAQLTLEHARGKIKQDKILNNDILTK